MGAIADIAEKQMAKIFKNLAKHIGADLTNMHIGIFYEKGGCRYFAYKDNMRVMVYPEDQKWDFDLEDFVGFLIDFSGFTEIAKGTIGQAGARFAGECKCNVDDVSIIMKYRDGDLPKAFLMCRNVKVREVNIETEFLKIL